MPRLSHLPNELLLAIGLHLDSSRDASSLTRINRHFHWLFFDYLLGFWFKPRSSAVHENNLLRLFFHATRHNSANIIQWLTSSTRALSFTGHIPTEYTSSIGEIALRGVTFLHFAALADAPRVAAHLIKHGADINQVVEGYPDLTPLCLTVSQSLTSKQKDLDSALRIASSYALPRTTRFLLARGADATSLKYGIAALHAAVIRRLPWRMFKMMYLGTTDTARTMLHKFADSDMLWRSMILQTVSELLKFGAKVQLQTTTSRIHKCNHRCWRSLDCDHRGQTALHLACASGIKEVVLLLLESGADASLPNDDGYTLLYYALVQAHGDAALTLLDWIPNTTNPIVFSHHRATALHVACRYAFSPMVAVLLKRGADANALDVNERTPLYEVLGQSQPERQRDVIMTLKLLDKFEADPNITSGELSPWQLAEAHPFKEVRQMFSQIDERNWPYTASRYVPHSVFKDDTIDGISEGHMKARRKRSSIEHHLSDFNSAGGQCPILNSTTPKINTATGGRTWIPDKAERLKRGPAASASPPRSQTAGVASASSPPLASPETTRERNHAIDSQLVDWSRISLMERAKQRSSKAASPNQALSLRQVPPANSSVTSPRETDQAASKFWAALPKQMTGGWRVDKDCNVKPEQVRKSSAHGRKKWKHLQL